MDYSQGKIYKLTSMHTDKIYIGSTKFSLSRRLKEHKLQFSGKKYSTSVEILKLGDYSIELVELFPCNSRKELEIREGILQLENIGIIVNKNIAGAGRPAEYRAEYRKNNKQKISEYQAEYKAKYRENNKQKLAEYNTKYKENNKQKIAESKAEYYTNHKQKILEYQAEYYTNHKQKISECAAKTD